MLLQPVLYEHLDAAVAQPGAGCRLETGPGDADIAGDFAALHRQHALFRALIAGDHLDLGAEDRVGQNRIEVGRAAGAGNNQLLLEHAVKALHRRGMPGEADVVFLERAAEPTELPRIELDALDTS